VLRVVLRVLQRVLQLLLLLQLLRHVRVLLRVLLREDRLDLFAPDACPGCGGVTCTSSVRPHTLVA
jgi:hypothetical protein